MLFNPEASKYTRNHQKMMGAFLAQWSIAFLKTKQTRHLHRGETHEN